MDTTFKTGRSSKRARGRRSAATARPRLRRVLIIALLLLVVYKVGRTGLYAWQAAHNGNQILSLLEEEPSGQQLPQLRAELTRFSASLTGLDRELRPLGVLLSPLRLFGSYGATLAAAPHLLTAGAEMSQLGVDGLALLAPALQNGVGDLSAATLLPALEASGDRMSELAEGAVLAEKALAKVDAERLHPRLREPVAQAQTMIAALPAGLQLAPYLSDLLGADEPKTYLILVQNNDELRATGGFLAGIGTVTVDKGKPVDRQFVDSYKFYSQEIEYPRSPDPMQRFMDVELMLLRDANWSPDFPTSARTVQAIYALETDQAIDGIVSVDLRAAALIVDALGPLQLEGSDEPVTGANIADSVKRFWDTPVAIEDSIDEVSLGQWWQRRKDFMPALVEAALARLQAGNLNTVGLMRAGLQSLNERAIQVWLRTPEAAAVLAEMGWDGGLQADPDHDFLALVDTNMGYNKVNVVVDQAIDYALDWPQGPDQPALATATITYRHTLPVPNHLCDPEPRYGEDYEDMTERCFFNYVRLYVPADSELVSAEGLDSDSVTSQRGESNTQVLAGFFVQEAGSEHTVRFTYRLPAHIGPDDYALTVQRQSGTQPLPVTATVAGASLEEIVTDNRLDWIPR